jgi:hypothetical protein
MALETYNANDIVYTVSPEPELPIGLRPQAVIRGRLLDEMTNQPSAGAVYIDSPYAGISPRVGSGGLVGFAAIPVRAFPNLKNAPVSVPVSLLADGYLPLFRDVPILQDMNFPESFSGGDMGDMLLHRLPTVISGRVLLNTGTAATAIPGAAITLTGVWRSLPPANLVVPPAPPDLVSLSPGIYSDRSAAGSQVQGLKFLGTPGPDKTLLHDAMADQPQLMLSDRHLIAPNDILAIDTADAERTEFVSIKTVTGASTDDLPAQVTLASPLRSSHRQGATVHKVQFQNVGPVIALSDDAIAGDVCIFVNGVANLASAPFLSVTQGTMPTEYHSVGYFQTTSNTQGFFRLPSISRIAQCELRCHDGVHTDLDILHCPNYEAEVSRIDFAYH